MKLNRVAVTGLGAMSGLGNSTAEVWKNALAGLSGVSSIAQASDEAMWPVRIAAQVKNFVIADEILHPKEHDRYDKFIHYALHCGAEAITQAGLLEAKYDPYKIGAIMGTGLGGFPIIEQTHQTYLEKGPRRISPFFIPSFIPNMATGKLAIHYNFRGINHTVASACASAAHAISAAATEIMLGRQDAMITGGAESVITALTAAGFNAMKALSKRNESPELASRPFDRDRDGFVIGEGAGILVLENYDKAVARGAKIIAEIAGFASTCDAYHITSPHPDGEGTVPCMLQSIEAAGIKKEDIGYINAHGTSTPTGDIAETNAIKKAFGDHANKLDISSTKSMTGHLLGAAGGLESVFCIKALQDGILPPTINLQNPSEGCDLNYVPNTAKKKDIQYALNNSFGFGATNSTLIFKKI